MRFDIDFKEYYPLVMIDGKRFFVDLGQDECICRGGRFMFMGRDYQCGESLLHRNLEDVSRDLGEQVDGMLGRSVLGQYKVRFDYPNAVLEVSETDFDTEGWEVLPFTKGNGIFVSGSIGGKSGKILVDSGFKAVYVTDPSLLIDPLEDFIKDTTSRGGTFEKRLYQFDINIGSIRYTDKGTDFPDDDMPMFRQDLRIVGAVGFKFFAQAEMVMDFEQSRFYIKKK